MSNKKDDTFVQDMVNAATPLEEQFPAELDPDAYPGPLEVGYRVVQASRAKYETLSEAQDYFDALRERTGWTHQTPIFRTARYWCRRVF